MYSSAAGTFAAGHDSAGVTSPSLEWFFAEGATGAFFDTFILLANPNASEAVVRATYLLPSGQTVQKDHIVPAQQPPRRSMSSSRTRGWPGPRFRPASRRPTAFRSWPSARCGGRTASPGSRPTTPRVRRRPAPSGRSATARSGCCRRTRATYVLIANTSAFAGTLRVTLLFESGAAVSQDFTVAANSRFNVPVVTAEAPVSPTTCGCRVAHASAPLLRAWEHAGPDRGRAGDVLERQRPVLGRGLGPGGDPTAVADAQAAAQPRRLAAVAIRPAKSPRADRRVRRPPRQQRLVWRR